MVTESKLSFLCLCECFIPENPDWVICRSHEWLAKKKSLQTSGNPTNEAVVTHLSFLLPSMIKKMKTISIWRDVISWPICLASCISFCFKRILQPRARTHREMHTITFTLFTSTALKTKNITSKHTDESVIGWSGYNDTLSIFYSRACQAGISR